MKKSTSDTAGYPLRGINREDWQLFVALCQLQRISAAEKLRQFIGKEADKMRAKLK